jgi:cell division protein FtsI (penicillin-binding protein 3)
MEPKKDMLLRTYLIYVGVVIFGLLILYRIGHIQFAEGEKWQERSRELTTEVRSIDAVRGNIYSADERLLATSIPVYEIRMDPNADAISDELFEEKVAPLADSLASIFGDQSAKAWERELVDARREGERFHLIADGVDHNQLQRLKRFPLFQKGRYKGGFIALQRNIRERPFKLLASRTIGYDREEVHPVGLEGAYSNELSGVEGKRLMRRISGGDWMPIGEDHRIDPKDGKDLHTTIDLNMQDVAERALLRQLKKHHADHGCVVLMEVETGAIKAIANLTRRENGEYAETYNYAIGESTEPGSTFKLPALMAALEDGRVELSDSVDTEDGVTTYYDQVMRDAHRGGFGKITVRRAFEVSSNVGISKTLYQAYNKEPSRLVDRLHQMHLDRKLELPIAGEGDPLVKEPGDPTWSGVTLPWMSIGYEVRQTPLQILTFYNAVANGGELVKPRFVNSIRKKGKVVERKEPVVIDGSICSESTIEKAQDLLEGVVESGTATNLKKADFDVAGKTGTAQIANERYGYSYESEVSHQASFCGYFPAKDPEFSCIVVVNAPSEDVYYGNLVAGPIFREIADKVYANSLDIQQPIAEKNGSLPDRERVVSAKHGSRKDLKGVMEELELPFSNEGASDWAVALPRKENTELATRRIDQKRVPNVKGMGLKDALFLLENRGLQVDVKGSGQVVEQSVEPGTSLDQVERIQLRAG